VLLDTSDLTFDEVVDRLCREARTRAAMPGWNA
jgi:hypothetical protein